jgi:hypothetical protein
MMAQELHHMLMMDENGLVQNIAVWDGITPLILKEGWTVAELEPGEYYEFGKPRGYQSPQPEPLPEQNTAGPKRKSSIT